MPGERDRTADQVEGDEGGQEWEVHVGGDDVPSISKHHPYWYEEKSAVFASSVADPGCLFRVRIFFPSPVPNLGSKKFRIPNPEQRF